ncbi:DsbA family protein [Bifidobacterium leontopitheci]|uniref:Disulfide bond formation protein DsbA n=1 Tax=Bifidobacterium leontopitheci TaxID=2650774 RepID=A0A6I1GDA4_9BIFI|nr:thioredoxin domain-containing protein [Bifidobacterium leontopitheci]KAB7789620.1 disulfide bond formation protein DsbA [Bifidobacterium leontopitheci]
MAQSKKPADKRNTRANRRAAEERAAKERAEQAAKERRQQTIIGAIVVVIVVALLAVAGVAIWNAIEKNKKNNISESQAYEQLQQVETKPERADKKGGFLLSSEGYGKTVAGAPTVAVYFDPLCPGCGEFNRQVDPTLISMVNAGQINLELHPMSFMDQYSTDEYSSRASGAVAYIADHDDDYNHLLKFIANIYAEDFQPGEASEYKSVSNDKLKEQAVKAGVSKSVADKAFGGEYKAWLEAINIYTPKRPELWQVTGSYKGTMSTPTITINGNYWDRNQLSLAGLDMKNGLIQSLGMTSSQVGQKGVMPSIGASGKPISLTTGK